MATTTLRGETFQKVDTGLSKLGLDLKHVELGDSKGSFDPMADIDKLVGEAKQRESEAGSGLELDLDLGFDPSELGKDLSTRTEEEKLLGQAQGHIAEKAWKEAIGVLETLLERMPEHVEGRYLKAKCHVELGSVDQDMQALRTLKGLREQLQPGKLRTMVDILRARIRDRLLVAVMLQAQLFRAIGSMDMATKQLRELVELDPASALYHFVLASTLSMANEWQQAYEVVEHGLRVSSSEDREKLEALQRKVGARVFKEHAQPAAELMKLGKYSAARGALRLKAKQFSTLPLFVAFDEYLRKLQGSGLFNAFFNKKWDVLPPPDHEELAEDIYFLIVHRELTQAKALRKSGRYDEAQACLRDAIEHTPDFPYVHFLLAGALYEGLATGLEKRRPPIGVVLSELREALNHAQVARRDPEITSAADLCKTIEQTLRTLEQVRKANEAREAEAGLINEFIERFNKVMTKVGSGISSVSQFREVHRGMASLQRELPAMKRKISSREGREVLARLEREIKRHCDTLEGMKGSVEEGEKVESVVSQFNSIMKGLERSGGISSASQLSDVRTKLFALSMEVDSARHSVSSADARKTLEKLSSAIDSHLQQLQGAASKVAVQECVAAFNGAMTMVNQGGPISSMSQLEQYQKLFRSVRSKARDARSNLPTSSGGSSGLGRFSLSSFDDPASEERKVLDELIEACDKVLSQLGD